MMATRETGRGRAPPALRASLAALRGALPVVVVLLDVDPGALAGCGLPGCASGGDQDGDCRDDCIDPDCAASLAEVCDDGFDNDGDGLVDCLDDDCQGCAFCPGDGYTDCDDSECDGDPNCP